MGVCFVSVINTIADKMLTKKVKIRDDNNLDVLRKLTKQLDCGYVDAIELENKYKNIVLSNFETLMLTKKNGVIVYLSANCYDIIGHTVDDLLYKTFNIIYPDDMNKFVNFVTQASSGVVGKDFEYRIVTKDGQVKTILHSCAPLYVNNDICIIVNIIYKKMA